MATEWQFTFPASRTCLWDETPTAESLDLHLTRNSWLCVQYSFSALQLAVRHAKQKPSKTLDCFLIGTAWITEAEGVALEVDRFDPGRLDVSGQKLLPTTLIPGDIAVPCQVVVGCPPQTTHLTHNLANMQEGFKELKRSLSLHPSSLDPALLLSLRIHCACSMDGVLTVQCGCIMPALVCEATPIKDIAIVKTALARNLSGPLPLSALQGRIKHGYITMESTRKLVLLLHSDPKASALPLVGIWISGVGSIYHPLVWLACVKYVYSSGLCDRVWGEGGRFVTLVYCEGSTQPTYWQCTIRNGGVGEMVPFEIASGETLVKSATDHDAVCIELHPALESSALHTLLEAAVKSSDTSSSLATSPYIHPKGMSCELPLPLPQPTPTQAPLAPSRDSELSMLSCLSLTEDGPQQQSPLSHSRSHHLNHHTTTPSIQPQSHTKNKENIPPNGEKESTVAITPLQSSKISQIQSVTTSKQTVTPEKSSLMIQTTPTLNRHETLRQQELEEQLKALQEQVKCLLSAQSETPRTPTTATPTNEVSTNTGESLYWPHPPPLFTLSPQGTQSSMCDENTSMCSSVMAGLSVDTATSVLSRNTSEIHLDLQSFVNSPSSSQSDSFGESASTAGDRVNNSYSEEGNNSEGGSPVSLLFKDQQQFYRNMLAQVNDLLQTQSPTEDSTPRGSCSDPSTDNTPEHTVTPSTPVHEASPTKHSIASDHHSHHSMSGYISDRLSEREHSLPTSETRSRMSSLSHNSTAILPQSKELDISAPLPHVHTSTREENSSPILPPHSSPFHIHPDVLQQYYTTDISMLPVPRIMYSRGIDDASVGETLLLPGSHHHHHLGSADCTIDENTQLADMIALKYIKGKANVGSTSGILQSDELYGSGLNKDTLTGLSTFDGGTNMSMATRQYLQRHHLMPGPAGGSVREEKSSSSVCSENGSESGKILDIQRLRTLPKLI